MRGARFRSPAAASVSVLVPLALVGCTVLLGANASPSLQGTITLLLCNLIVVCGLQVFIGNSGVYSFGQLGFAAIGAYLAALLTLPAAFALLQAPALPDVFAEAQLHPIPSTLIAAVACAGLAGLVGWPLMRTSTLAIPISTFAFLIVTYDVLAHWDAVTGGSGGLVSLPRTTGVVSAGIWAAVAVVIALAYKWSSSGYRAQATREDEVASQAIGINVVRERLIAFTISGALCGLGGALAAHQSGVLNPTTFYFGATVTTLTMLVLGGARSVLGAVVGAIAVSGVNEVLRGLEDGATLLGAVSIDETPGLAAIGLGLVLLVTMIAMPDGLTGGREAGELPWARRLPGMRMSGVAARGSGLVARRGGGALAARGISVSFAGLQVLRGVSLELGRGEALGLIGPNGAGKTTLVNVLSGFQAPEGGSIILEGDELGGRSAARIARLGLARTFQSALPFARLSCLENVAIGAMGVGQSRSRSIATSAAVLERLGMSECAALPAGSLPPARQRLLGIARALATAPAYLLLDEPAAGLSQQERVELAAVLGKLLGDFGCGMLLIEHDVDFVAELCPRIQVLDDGATVCVGSAAEVRENPAVIESYLGLAFVAGDSA